MIPIYDIMVTIPVGDLYGLLQHVTLVGKPANFEYA